MKQRSRRGFALIAVLWVIVGAAILGRALGDRSGETVAAALNRIALLRAAWHAEACAERALAAIADELELDRAHMLPRGRSRWDTLDSLVVRAPLTDGCELTLRPAGTTVDVNTAAGDDLHQLLIASGVPESRVDSLVDAVLDWRDADSTARPNGAERDWYEQVRRPLPRNGPLAAVEELHAIRGFEVLLSLDTLLGIENERILLPRAPMAVLATLPGIGPEVLAHIAVGRAAGAPMRDLAQLAALLSPPARASMWAHSAELARRLATTPDAWTVTSIASDGRPPISAAVELRLVRAAGRVAIVRRRGWP